MSENEFTTFLNKRPFMPFRVEVSDGTSYVIRHPEMVIPAGYAAAIGVPRKKGKGYERIEIVAMEHIVKLVPLPMPAKESA